MTILPVDGATDADSWTVAGECMLPKLWSENAPRISFEKLHRCAAAIGGRQGTSRNQKSTRHRVKYFQNTHQQVKAKILERMAEWSEEFSKDPDLGIMDQAYMKLKTQSMLLSMSKNGKLTTIRSQSLPSVQAEQATDHRRR